MTRRVELLLVSAPAVLLAVAWSVTTALGAWGLNPIWHVERLNLPEAAALRDRGEVARLLEAGADPTAVEDVRGGFLYEETTPLSAVDAAIRADRPEILQLFFDHGPKLDSRTWTTAWCTATDPQMRALLEASQPEHPAPDCLPPLR